MGADSFAVYYGLRDTVQSGEGRNLLECRCSPRQLAARMAGPQTRFRRATDGEYYFLLIGTQTGIFSVENKMDASVSDEAMRELIDSTKAKLNDAGFHEEPRVIFQVAADY